MTMMRKVFDGGWPRWFIVSAALTILLCAFSIQKRVRVERNNRATALAVDMDVIETLAASDGRTLPEALKDLRAQGVYAAVISEETLGEVIQRNDAHVEGDMLAIPASGRLTDRIKKGVLARFPKAEFKTLEDGGLVIVGVPMTELRTTSLGIDPDLSRTARAAGMTVIGRLGNPLGATPEYIDKTISWMRQMGAKVFLPLGEQVLGRREALQSTVEALRKYGVLYATPEFTKIGGDANIVDSAPELVVRLHSAQAAELDKLPYEEAVDRYAKASRERNMRILLIRPVSNSGTSGIASLAKFAKDIHDSIVHDGGAVGFMKPYPDSEVSSWLKLLIVLSLIPALVLAAKLVTQSDAITLVAAVLGLLLAVAGLKIGFGLAALLATLVYPILAVCWLRERGGDHPFLDLLVMCGISVIGGFVVAGLLNGLPYFIKASEFQGIKVAVFVPILVGTWLLCNHFFDLKAALRRPMTWIGALTAIGILAALMFMNSRTGNDNAAGVSDMELKFRNLLDTFLPVRPRTKSFLIGHPALFVGLSLLAYCRRADVKKWIPVAVALISTGLIGQTDIVNTFCHLHTPFMLSLLRNTVGLVLGVILGTVIWQLLRRRFENKVSA
jgi:hypothetical protein